MHALEGIGLVVELLEGLDEDETLSIRSVWCQMLEWTRHTEGDRAHDGDEHMLLLVEGAGVEAEPPPKEGHLALGEHALEELAEGEGKELSDACLHADSGHAGLENWGKHKLGCTSTSTSTDAD